MKLIDLTGQNFGRLIVLQRVPDKLKGKPKWECLCDCGKKTEVSGNNLKSGHTRSCGCIFRTMNLRHGHSRNVKGDKDTPEYRSWVALKARTHGGKNHQVFFKKYKGRGITMCERWKTFENFLSDMGLKPSPKHSIDRINNELGYSPENCRWATAKEQSRNTRRNVYLTYEGQTECLSEWASILGMKVNTIHNRLKSGMTVKQAFEAPRYSRNKKTNAPTT